MPLTATYTAAELAALPDHVLTVDLSAYRILLPATGFFVFAKKTDNVDISLTILVE